MVADFDASSPANQWQRFCQMLWHHQDLGFWLDVSRMALGQQDLDGLAPRFDAAFAAIAALEAGAIANADEGRQAEPGLLRRLPVPGAQLILLRVQVVLAALANSSALKSSKPE